MKKTILAATIVLLSITGFNASAQTSKASDSKAKTECPANCDCDKACKKGNDKCAKDKKGKKGNRDHALRAFRGIELNADQKAKLEALNAENKARREAAKAESKARREAAKAENKARGEAADAQRQQMKADRQKAKDAYIASVKTILTPEQFAQFEKNMQQPSKDKKHDKNGKDNTKKSKGHGKRGDDNSKRSRS